MSYTRSFTKTVSIPYSKSVSYPASEHGGSMTVSGYATDQVEVNIHVDTSPYDREVSSCSSKVGLLTGAIAATEVAQVASVHSNAKKVGKAIVDGFFKTVRSEISQQISALRSEVNSTVIHLRELAKRCIDKRRQMQADYDRLTSRYSKTFSDLNRELENRIYMLDKYAFDLRRHTEQYTLPLISSELVGDAAVISAEQAEITAILSSARTKELAQSTIGEINKYLQEQAKADALLRECTVASEGEPVKYAPVIHFQRVEADRSIARNTYVPEPLMQFAADHTHGWLQQYPWQKLSQEDMAALNQLFEENLAEGVKGNSEHDNRVRQAARQLFNADAAKGFNS